MLGLWGGGGLERWSIYGGIVCVDLVQPLRGCGRWGLWTVGFAHGYFCLAPSGLRAG